MAIRQEKLKSPSAEQEPQRRLVTALADLRDRDAADALAALADGWS